ncbi:PREDICTED: GDNF family receptor alpha-1-like [Cyprinodon variegatus]|uniref:GDNF family receptor alpha-1-like n=1 Tax=Cyprinodon variegatus TaxID=28743 RepID=UPI0007426665|nr:PREDICTED: GDNF family receptor alpha-1-like [Cyprinodon variegatus]
MIFSLFCFLPLFDVLTYAEENLRASRLDCVRASEQCLREQACSTKYRTMRQCVAGGKESNFSRVAGVEARDECRSAMEALKQSPLYNCRCKRGMKKEKNCLRIYWGIYQSLQGNDFLEESPYEPVNKRLSDIFRLAPILGEPAVARENNCLTAAKACNLNDTCKKYRSAYISPCTSRVSTAEICNKRKCHKALRQFFDKVPPKHSYGMLFCSCPVSDQTACSERRRQTIVPVCSYEEKQKPNCLELQETCKTNYICTVMTPNYLRSPKISVSPFCDCTNSGNKKDDCDKFTEFFTENTCLRNAIQAFGNGTDIGMRPPISPLQTTTSITTPYQKNRERNPNTIDNQINADPSLLHFCGNLQAQKLHSNATVDVCSSDPQAPKVDGPSASNAILRDSAVCRQSVGVTSLLPLLLYFGARGYL